MSLSVSLAIASSGLASINSQLGVTSQNVANASTPGYAAEVMGNRAAEAGGVGDGVRTGPATAQTDAALQAAVDAQDGDVAALQVRSDALASIDAAQGTTGAGDDLASQLGALADAFTTLGADPSNQAQQAAVVSAAGTLADGIRNQSAAYAAARQGAQDGLVSDVTALNTAVRTIGQLSDRIVAAAAQGQGTADLEAQRRTQEQTAGQLGGLRFLPSANGDVTAVAGAAVVDTRAASGPFVVAAATVGPGSTAPPVQLAGSDAGAQLSGSIGARLRLRDATLPQAQAGLDEFAATLSARLGNQGLSLFTDPAGALPATGGTPSQAGSVGYAGIIQVNPAVASNPALVRDGTQAVAAGTGGASAFTPNPAGGPAGFTTLIGRVLTYAFGSQAQAGTSQPPPATTGLGADGTLSLGYSAGTTLQGFAANLVAAQAQAAGDASDALTTGQAVQATLQTKLSSETGVSVDTELANMLVLQNAYGANAKIINAVQTMWTDLLNAVVPA